MKKKTNPFDILKRIGALLLLMAMTVMIAVPVFAEPEDENETNPAEALFDLIPYNNDLEILLNTNTINNVKTVRTYFPTPYGVDTTWEFPYSDEFFSQPDNYYCHLFAQGSLGLAVSTFRSPQLNQNNYDNLAAYLGNIGFGNIEAEPYLHTPTTTSVTYAIANKKIGDQTIIAVSCCGAGYGAEWSGNLTVGDEERHLGFNTAATTVKKAIYDYINKHNITGKVSLWATGYSRAAAIMNIVAADMTSSKDFAHVFAYTFATPRTCMDSGNYPNIFNIVGKSDPVATIPFADWGYTRYGVTLYTPTEETDSDFSEKKLKMNDLMNQIDDHSYIYNPDVNKQMRTLFDYIVSLLPNASVYSEELQPGVLNVMAKGNMDNILSLVSNIFTTFKADTPEEQAELDNLLDYVQELANQYVLKGNSEQIEKGMWSQELNVTQNLTTEHNPDKYIAWMFLSDDPEQIFGQNTSFTNFTIRGNVTLDIFSDDGYVETIDPNGNVYVRDSTDEIEFVDKGEHEFYIEHNSGQLNFTIPGDKGYVIIMTSATDQQVSYFGSVHTDNSVHFKLEKVYTLNMQANQTYPLYFSERAETWVDDLNDEAGTIDVWSDSVFYSPSIILRLQKINVLHLTIKQIAVSLVLLVIFAYTEMVICLTLAFVRLIQKRPRRAPATIAVHIVNAAIFFALEFAMWFFVPAYPIAQLSAKIICFLFIFSLTFIGLLSHPCRKNLFLFLGVLAGMAVSFALDHILLIKVNRYTFIAKLLIYAILAIVASLTWLGHTQRRAARIESVEMARHERQMLKNEKDVAKAYAKAERATKHHILQKQKAEKRAAARAARNEAKQAKKN